jgi:di/tricarboxylate transporter
LDRSNAVRILGAIDERLSNRERAPRALAIFAGAMVAATLNVVSLPVAMLTGALLVFVTRCITPEEAYSQVNWTAIVLIACMLALGSAMEFTGTAEFLAANLVRWIGHAQPLWLLTAFFALTVLLTQPMSNQAAAVVVLPVAMQTAAQLGLNPRAFAMIVALGASCSFLTPLEPACLLVYGPGRYQFLDFLKVGWIPSLLIYLISIVMVPQLWPLSTLP